MQQVIGPETVRRSVPQREFLELCLKFDKIYLNRS